MSPTRAPPPPAGSRAFTVRLGDDALVAVARRTGKALPAKGDVVAECGRLGVVAELDAGAIDRLCAGRTPVGADVVVARGIAPRPGVPERFEYGFVLPQDNHAYSDEIGDESVDFREGVLAERVAAGARLAVRRPGTPGTPGRSVRGEAIAPPSPRAARLEIGANVALSPDGSSATATADGTPVVRAGRLSVLVAFEVASVGYATGNIHYDGAVVVRGDVERGFCVCATGDVEIGGIVDGGTVLSGGEVHVHAGVRQGACIEAASDVSVRFVDSDSEVCSLGDVTVAGGAVHCRVTSGRAVRIAHAACGALVRAGSRIEVGEAGGHGGTATLLEVRRPVIEGEIDPLRALRADRLERVAQLDRAAVAPAVELRARKGTTAARVQALVEIALATARIVAGEACAGATSTAGEIAVRRVVHPGVDFVVHGHVALPTRDDDARTYVWSPRGAPYVPPPWVTASHAPPHALPGARSAHPDARLASRPVASGRPAPSSLTPGSRASFPPIPRATTSPHASTLAPPAEGGGVGRAGSTVAPLGDRGERRR